MIPDSTGLKRGRRSILRQRLALLLLLAPLLATEAAAQTVNYGAMEQLFGESVTTSATGQPQRAT